jgi:hypothetical protein
MTAAGDRRESNKKRERRERVREACLDALYHCAIENGLGRGDGGWLSDWLIELVIDELRQQPMPSPQEGFTAWLIALGGLRRDFEDALESAFEDQPGFDPIEFSRELARELVS